jgi:uncharacterized protein YecT (DUF1311 family)
MKHWDLDTGAAQLRDALQDLERAWLVVSEAWSDDISRQFSEHHLDPIVPASKMALDATARMNQLLRRAQTECDE